MPKHQNWGGFAANVDVLQNRMDACAFRMHALSPTKERRDFSRGLLTEHRRLVDYTHCLWRTIPTNRPKVLKTQNPKS